MKMHFYRRQCHRMLHHRISITTITTTNNNRHLAVIATNVSAWSSGIDHCIQNTCQDGVHANVVYKNAFPFYQMTPFSLFNINYLNIYHQHIKKDIFYYKSFSNYYIKKNIINRKQNIIRWNNNYINVTWNLQDQRIDLEWRNKKKQEK